MLDRYFREQASQDIKRRIATCFVAVNVTAEVNVTAAVNVITKDVAGYYTLAATSIGLNSLTPEIVKKLPRYPVVPAVLLGRLAVALHCQGQGLGGILLADALIRTSQAEFGVFAMVVDAKDSAAQDFYEHYGFTRLTDAEARRLFLPIGAALRHLANRRHRG
jgi:predicted GNAT family N-acyltransferase